MFLTAAIKRDTKKSEAGLGLLPRRTRVQHHWWLSSSDCGRGWPGCPWPSLTAHVGATWISLTPAHEGLSPEACSHLLIPSLFLCLLSLILMTTIQANSRRTGLIWIILAACIMLFTFVKYGIARSHWVKFSLKIVLFSHPLFIG